MGQSLKNNKGFTLVEVMIAAGIMGVMAVFFYKFFADQIKQQKTVMQRMDEMNIINEVRLLLMNTDNCAESFKKYEVTSSKSEDDLDAIKSLKKVYIKYEEGKDDPDKEVIEKYLTYVKGDRDRLYGQTNIKIKSYDIEATSDDVKILNKYKTGEVQFIVEFDRGEGKFGNQLKKYKIPLSVQVDDGREITSCSSMGLPAGGEAGLVTLDIKTNPGYLGKSGNTACKDKGLSCAYVTSTNYVETASGLDSPLYTPACLSSYNKSLKGVKDGVGLSNIHSCDALIGKYTTFELTIEATSIICSANFSAVCN